MWLPVVQQRRLYHEGGRAPCTEQRYDTRQSERKRERRRRKEEDLLLLVNACVWIRIFECWMYSLRIPLEYRCIDTTCTYTYCPLAHTRRVVYITYLFVLSIIRHTHKEGVWLFSSPLVLVSSSSSNGLRLLRIPLFSVLSLRVSSSHLPSE